MTDKVAAEGLIASPASQKWGLNYSVNAIELVADLLVELKPEDLAARAAKMVATLRHAASRINAHRLAEVSSPARPQLEDPDVQLLAWAVSNCHTLARRRLHAGSMDTEWWQHVLRICEKAGAQSKGVLRAALPTEMTEGAVSAAPPALEQLLAEWDKEVSENGLWTSGHSIAAGIVARLRAPREEP